MKLGMDHIDEATDEKLHFLAQMGVEGIMAAPNVRPDNNGYHELEDLRELKDRVEEHGMELAAYKGSSPWEWNHKWMLGLPGRDEQIENFQRTLRNLAAADVPLCTFNIHAMQFFRTGHHTRGRAGAIGSSFDAELAKDLPLFATSLRHVNLDLIPKSQRSPVGDDQMWSNLRYFLQAVVPVAEELGVQLALHPDDPQVPEIGGVARIMRSPDALRRAMGIAHSEHYGMLFCVGCFTQMGADVPAEIRSFGGEGKLRWVHFRNITGTTENFVETFPDDGDTDMYAVIKALAEVGYDGYLVPDHSLGVEGDTAWGHRYWAYSLGFIKAMILAAR